MNRALISIAALVLPLAGLGTVWLTTDRASRQGTEWDVPIEGYDPRDLLQGHYVQFQYDWPGLKVAEDGPGLGFAPLCLTGSAPRLDKVAVKAAGQPCEHFVRDEESQEGRLYASQAEAARLQKQLWDRTLQGVIRIRLRSDGHVTPLRLTFRPRPPEPQGRASPAQ
jgi:hypothetical protein